MKPALITIAISTALVIFATMFYASYTEQKAKELGIKAPAQTEKAAS